MSVIFFCLQKSDSSSGRVASRAILRASAKEGSTPIVWPLSSVECLQRYDLVRANQRRDRLVGAKGGGRS